MFSAKEREMFKALRYRDATIRAYESNPIALYRRAAKSTSAKAVYSLHRCVRAIEDYDPDRNTPEFDALIDV